MRVVLSCEHGGNAIPAAYRRLFAESGWLLSTHRGLDVGARELANGFRRSLGAPLVMQTTSRLVVDCNRSESSPTLHAPRLARLSEAERATLLTRHYRPHREAVKRHVQSALQQGHTVVHLSVHSFTPVLRGERRTTDVGLLFDPGRAREARFCALWRHELTQRLPKLSVHLNRPYSGAGDGLTTTLRQALPAARYLGLEVEVNQRFPRRSPRAFAELQRALIASFVATLEA